MSRRVDFPAPEGPMMAMSCRGRNLPWRSWRICFLPA